MNEFIFNFAPTGMVTSKSTNKYVPLTPQEIAQDVLMGAELGVNVVHIHARDPDTGHPTYKKDIYAEIIQEIRKYHKDLVICVSTSGREWTDFEKRSQVLSLNSEVKPDLASLTLGSLNFSNQASINGPRIIHQLASEMKRQNIRPELEVFDPGMINYAKYLIKKGILTPPYYFNIILGNIASAQADMVSLGLMLRELPADSYWSVGGVGSPQQLQMNVLGLLFSGGVRTGLEDNIWLDAQKKEMASNYDIVSRIAKIAQIMQMKPYSHKTTRKILGVDP